MYGFTLDHKISSKQLGLRFTAPVEIPAAARRVDDIKVSGRAGSLTRFTGWADTEITLPLAVQSGVEAYRQACFVLMDASAISFSGEPGLFRYIKHVEVSPLAREMGSCAPFTYLDAGLKSATLNASGTLLNPGLLPADPVITVFGTGQLELTINSTKHVVASPAGQVTLDSARLVGHVAGKAQSDALTGAFPQLQPGTNQIEFGAGVSKIVVQPNWRTL